MTFSKSITLVHLLFSAFIYTACMPVNETEATATRVEKHYADKFETYAEWFALPSEYLCALAAIEVSGRKEIPHRFEPHVYKKLLAVKNGNPDKFENILPQDLKAVPDSNLRKMAKSWGPFQIMGYKCFYLHLTVDQLIDSSSFYGAQWIDLSYGDLLRKGDFKNAFHFHNTGKMYPDSGPPLTYNPNYVRNGMRYLKLFRNRKRQQKANDSISIRFR